MDLYFTEESLKYKKGKEIYQKVKKSNIIVDEQSFINMIKKKNLSYLEEKKYILFSVKKGKFLKEYYLDKRFAGIKEEYYFMYENSCIYSCDYCYLRDYFSHGATVFYVNLEDMFEELDGFSKSGKTISCGIVNDSLAIDNLTEIIPDLICYFSKNTNNILEIRTKSPNINSLLKQNPIDNLIVAFSINSDYIIKKYEKNTANLDQRINNIIKLQKMGYKIALRIDPMIYIENWEVEYCNLIKNIFSKIDKKLIYNIGIGCLRYKKGLKEAVSKESDTDIFFNEMVIGLDGKEKYFKGIRVMMYRKIIEEINKNGDFELYLGMETDNVWQQSGL